MVPTAVLWGAEVDRGRASRKVRVKVVRNMVSILAGYRIEGKDDMIRRSAYLPFHFDNIGSDDLLYASFWKQRILRDGPCDLIS